MEKRNYRRYYAASLLVLLALSAYPLVGGARMVALQLQNGGIAAEQYVKYVVPYAAMALAVVLFAAFQPLLFKLKRKALPVGLAGAYAVFVAAELLFEQLTLFPSGLASFNPATMTYNGAPATNVDAWQAGLCAISPDVSVPSVVQTYVEADNAYKIHYYFIALLLITMLCLLVYGGGKAVRAGDASKRKLLAMQGTATASLLALCVLANLTGFFRQAEAIQTPLASLLTCLFFVMLGVSVGLYVGSFTLHKRKRLSLGLPVLSALLAVVLMYVGEAAMMGGGLYRFGSGWFFTPLGALAVAPVDVAVIVAAGALTWLLLVLLDRRAYRAVRGVALTLALLVVSGWLAGWMTVAQEPVTVYDIGATVYYDPNSPVNLELPLWAYEPYSVTIDDDALTFTDKETQQTQQTQRLDAIADHAPYYFHTSGLFNPFTDVSQPQLHMQLEWPVTYGNGVSEQYGLYETNGTLCLYAVKNGRLWIACELIAAEH